jgi:hypothetical protein
LLPIGATPVEFCRAIGQFIACSTAQLSMPRYRRFQDFNTPYYSSTCTQLRCTLSVLLWLTCLVLPMPLLLLLLLLLLL